jgi:hypothetical protein
MGKPESAPPREYPRWRYHVAQAALVVQNKDDEAARTPDADGWVDRPEQAGAAPAPPPTEPPPAPAPPAAAPASHPTPNKKTTK